MHFNVTGNSGVAVSAVKQLDNAIAALEKRAAALQAINITGLAKGIVAPKFQWDEGLRQTDALVKNVQKAKMSVAEFRNVYKNNVDDIVRQQTRLAHATARPLGQGAFQITVPSHSEVTKFADATEIANRRLGVQAEILRGLGTKVQDWGKNTQWAGRQMMVGMTVPFAMAAAAAGMYANKIDAAMVRVEKVYNGSLDGFREKAMETANSITREVGQSVESSLKVMGELAAAGKQGAELMQTTKQSQILATLGDMDQESAIKGMISMQSIYKLNTEQLAEAVNYLNSVEDQTPTKLQDLVDAIPIAGTMVAQLGGTLQDTTVLLTAFRDRGIETVEGANAIKTAMNRILAPTKTATEMFKELTGQSLDNIIKQTGGKPLETLQAISDAVMGGNVALADQQRLISKLVGIYQSSRITALLAGLQESTGSVAVAKGVSSESPEQWAARTAKSLKAITESASGQWKIAVETFKTEMQPVGELALKVGTAIVKAFSGALSIFNAIPEPLRAVILGVTALVAVAGPISMIVGIFANFMGTIIKTGAFLTGMRSKYKSMTIEQKAAELSSGTLNQRLVSQSDATQILIYQLDKLRAAYVETTAASRALGTATRLPSSGQWNVSGMLNPRMTGLAMPLSGLTIPQKGDSSPIDRWNIAPLLEKNVDGLKAVGEEEKRNAGLARVFNSEVLMGVGMAAQLGSMAAGTGSELEKWLNWISLASIGIGAVLPLLSKVGQTIKGWALTSAIGGLTGKLGDSAKGFGSKLLTGGKAALGGLAALVTGPWGLAIGATIAGIWGVTKLINAGAEEQKRHQQAIVNSTDAWAKVLGKTKVEWGQIKDETGKVKDDVDAIVQKMRDEMPDVIQEIQNKRGADRWNVIEDEVMKLQGQGLGEQEIMNSMEALLRAASLKQDEIDEILGKINVRFDFSGGVKDLRQFLQNAREQVSGNLNQFVFEMPASPRAGGGEYAEERSAMQDQAADEIAGRFYDRLASLSAAEKGIYAKEFANNISQMFEDSFQLLDKDNKIASNWNEARKKFFEWNADEGKWVRSQALKDAIGAGEVTSEQAHQMDILIDTEQRYVQGIAKKLKLTEKDIRNMSQIRDILPYVTKGNLSAEEAQKSYNDVVEKAKKNGQELTDAEKQRLAQLYASTYGLNAATIANNGYASSNNKVAGTLLQTKYALMDFMKQLNGFPGAIEDFWEARAAGEGGFVDALGGDPASQAKSLIDTVKGAYSGAMNDIYGALAAQAEQQWQARLTAISESFERRREALQNQVESLDKSWDARMEATAEAYENRQKAIENESEAQVDAIEKQIKAEQDREEGRQRQFEAEKKRIERLTELANRNIDYNRALATGNLDEAARVMNNAEALTVSWSADDAKERTSLLSKDQVDQLTATKELIQKQKDARLEALKAEEEAVRKSMETQRDIERERLDNRLESLSKEQSATEAAERRKQEMNKRTLEIELATLKTFVPQNEQQLAEHVARVSSAYSNYGLNLQTAGGYWGQIIGNALSNNVNRARQEMSNNAAWAAFGSSVAGSISQGAFGLSLSDFFTLIATGQPPQGWTPPGTNAQTGSGYMNRPGGRIFYHTGGEVGVDSGGRPGLSYNSPLGADEYETVLKKGEFVFSKSAVQLFGSDNLKMMNAGIPPASPEVTGITGMFGSLMGAMGHSIIGLAMNNLMTWAAQKYMGAAGGGTGAAVDFAKAQDGKPYIWGGVGPAGYDCSGFMSAIANVLIGQENPYKRIFSTGMVKSGQPFGPFVPGLGGPFQIGVKHGNPGHTAGTLMGVPVESGSGHGPMYGKKAFGATDKQFNMFFHIPEDKIAAGAAIPGFGSVGGEPASDKVQQRVKAVAAGYGWAGGDMWTALYNLIQKESSWNPNAANPTSSARGLFQKMTSIHGPLEPTIEGQTQWGLNYIKGRYGNPVAAWAYHQRKGWYDTGGDVHPGVTALLNGTGKTETVVTHNTRKEITTALDNAAVTYKQLATTVHSFSPDILSKNVAGSTGDTYNDYDVNIIGSGLSQEQLELAIQNGIEKAEIRKKKKLGEIR